MNVVMPNTPQYNVTKRFTTGLLQGLEVTEVTTVAFTAGQEYQASAGSSDYLVVSCVPEAAEGDVVVAGPDNKRVEAHGFKGLDNKRWRKTFKNVAALNAWLEKHDAECIATRDAE